MEPSTQPETNDNTQPSAQEIPKVISLSEEYLQNISKFVEGNLKRITLTITNRHNCS